MTWYYLILSFVFFAMAVPVFGVSLAFIITDTVKNRKVAVKSVVVAVVSAVLISGGVLFNCSHSVSPRYNDRWIVGKTLTEVQARYGEFDVVYGQTAGYYTYTDNGPVMPDHLPHYYYMDFDENGVVTKIYDGARKGG